MNYLENEYQNSSEILKALAHPLRLCIVRGLLTKQGCNVKTMQQSVAIPQSTLSQHLFKLKSAKIIKGVKQGTAINYYVIDERAKKIIDIFFPTEKP